MCEITANDVSSLTVDDRSSISSDSAISSNDSVFASPVEVRIYGQKGEIDESWKIATSQRYTLISLIGMSTLVMME